ncbi:MAG: asparagine synthase (glutamine-hydrolyzing) [Gammaproteobacteria bacterium]|nr:asparagine synthase (glutamine-hydrolyzing) [Gammaproteobacteria bacterium]
MCGIAGMLQLTESSRSVDVELICRMRDSMAHRGPDGSGVWLSPQREVGLAHRRLAIVDLSESAAQPMCDGQLVLTFNGEIYNHAELRKELIQLGFANWQTDHSDTEVILKAYRAWGIDCVHRFRGMFAFALWDGAEKTLWLVRDRLGIKPLYYAEHSGRLLFASEIKALLQDPSLAREIDEEALFHYLTFLTTPAPMTLFAGIRKLPAGCRMRIDAHGGQQVERYWDAMTAAGEVDFIAPGERPEAVLQTLREAVRLRKLSDVDVGVFLSGGVDSSTNAALFSEGDSQPVRTFSIGYDADYESYPSELPFARQMASAVGAEHHERLLSVDDLLCFVPEMAYQQDEPIADPVCIPLYYVSKLARDSGVTVCQVGEGADELFFGYPQWHARLKMQRALNWPPLAAGGQWMMQRMGRTGGRPYEWLRRAASAQPLFWGGAEAFSEAGKQRLLSPDLRRRFAGHTSWDVLAPIRQRFLTSAGRNDHLNWMSYVDLNLRLPELLLMRVDKMSMATSLEARVPFLDHEFVSLVLSLPPADRMRGGVPKGLLKQAVRGIVPDQLIDRKKQGFGVPVHEWFFGALGEQVSRELAAFCDKTGLLDYAEIRRLSDLGAGVSLWPIYNLALWWRTFCSGDDAWQVG